MTTLASSAATRDDRDCRQPGAAQQCAPPARSLDIRKVEHEGHLDNQDDLRGWLVIANSATDQDVRQDGVAQLVGGQ